jgi:hypothetical protein
VLKKKKTTSSPQNTMDAHSMSKTKTNSYYVFGVQTPNPTQAGAHHPTVDRFVYRFY